MACLGKALALLLLALLTIFSTGAARAEDAPLMHLVERPDDQALIVTVTINGASVGDGLIAYQDNGRLLVPLVALLNTLEIHVDSDPETGKAAGFFINENRRFEFDLASGTASIDGKKLALPPDKVERQINDIYVDSSLFAEWFSIRLSLDLQNLTINVSSLELLPIQERLERERRRSGVPHGWEKGEYEVIEPTPSIISWPFIDNYIEFAANGDGKNQHQDVRYTSVVTGMVANLDVDMAVNGSIPDQSPLLRASVARRDPRGGLLGPIDAREIVVGDISSPAVPLIANSVAGRGGEISTFDFNRLSETERVTLRGELPVGWEVELYRGEELLNYQTNSADGRYEFANVNTVPGLNSFRLIFYGPQGQRREENHPIFATASSVGAGETGFRIAFNQQNVDLSETFAAAQSQPVTLFDQFDQIARNQIFGQTQLNDGLFRFVGEIEHGLSDTLAVTGTVSSVPVAGVSRQYLQTGVRGSWLGALTGIRVATSSAGGVAFGGSVQSTIYGISSLLTYDRFQNFVSERSFSPSLNEPLASQAELQLNTFLPDFAFGPTPFAFDAIYSQGWSGASSLELSERLQQYIGGYTLGWETLADIGGNRDTKVSEVARVGTQFGKVALRGESIIDLVPRPTFSAAKITADFRSDPDINLRLGVVHFNDTYHETQITGGVAKLFANFALGTDVTVGDKADFSVLFKISVSSGVDPRATRPILANHEIARSGAVSARVFLDKDHDGKFGPEDVPLPNVALHGAGMAEHSRTDESGTVFITGLQPYREIPISVDTETLEDPFWNPEDRKIAVLPRPGSTVQIDFPVYETGEIDGTVLLSRDGRRIPLPGIRVQLLDRDGKTVSQALSGHDGYFVLERIPLGRFMLSADPDQLGKLHLGAVVPMPVTVTRENPTASAGNVVLQRITAGDTVANSLR